MSTISIKAKEFAQFLKSVYLDGVIGECVVHTDEATIHVQAVDITNALFVDITAPFEQSPNCGDIGISDISFIIKALSKFGETNADLTVDGNRMHLRSGGNTIKYLLASPDAIPTVLADPGAVSNIRDACVYSVRVDEANKANLVSNISLFKKNTITVNIHNNGGRGTCSVACGTDSENQFIIQFGRVSLTEGAELVNVSFEVSADHMKAILDNTTGGEALPMLLMAADPRYPVLVAQGQNTWALMPTAAGAGA